MAYLIAHSGITWGYDASTAEAAVRDVALVGYNAYETIGGVIEAYEAEGRNYADLLAKYNIGLIGTYIGTQFRQGEDPAEDIANAQRWIARAKELGATTVLLAAGSRKEGPCEDEAGWRHIADAFAEMARIAKAAGMLTAVHPHTGTLLETRQDIDSFFAAANTDLLPFAPDTGQIAKAGDDAVATLEDYKEIIKHVHLKDYGGGRDTGYAGYTPIGEGVIDMAAIFGILDDVKYNGWVTVELDGTPQAPYAPLDAAQRSHDYLAQLLGKRVAWTMR
jgi:inosose dehydratase